jgi:hypothetical protein
VLLPASDPHPCLCPPLLPTRRLYTSVTLCCSSTAPTTGAHADCAVLQPAGNATQLPSVPPALPRCSNPIRRFHISTGGGVPHAGGAHLCVCLCVVPQLYHQKRPTHTPPRYPPSTERFQRNQGTTHSTTTHPHTELLCTHGVWCQRDPDKGVPVHGTRPAQH